MKHKIDKHQVTQRIMIQVACFLHRELPIRLAQRAVKLEASPLFARSGKLIPSMICNLLFITFLFLGNIKNVASWYKTSFAQLRACPVPNDPEKEAIFAKVIESIYERHSTTLITMAKGAHELRTMLNEDVATFADHEDIQKRLDDFYMSRIGIRMVTVSFFFFSFVTLTAFFFSLSSSADRAIFSSPPSTNGARNDWVNLSESITCRYCETSHSGRCIYVP